MALVIPDKVVLRLVDSEHKALRLANVLFQVHAFAKLKNDFRLGPFATDLEGVATVTKREMMAEVAAHYDSGLMDYHAIDECRPRVEIEAMQPQAIERALNARTHVWTALLKGESERWTSIDELRCLYRAAANERISAKAIRALWDGSSKEAIYSITAELV